MTDDRHRVIPSLLGMLQDVDTSTTPPGNGDGLVWDNTAEKWKPGTSAGFDPNEDPVIIGAGATAGGGSTPSNPSLGTSLNIAIGNSAAATGTGGSTAIGFAASATAGSDTAIGAGAQTTNIRAIAIGTGANGYGDDAIAIGTSAVVNATEGTAIGNGATVGVGHDGSTAIGDGAATTASGQIMMGNQRMYVEIAGNSSLGQQVGLVLTDKVSPHNRYIIQVSSGALVLSLAP